MQAWHGSIRVRSNEDIIFVTYHSLCADTSSSSKTCPFEISYFKLLFRFIAQEESWTAETNLNLVVVSYFKHAVL